MPFSSHTMIFSQEGKPRKCFFASDEDGHKHAHLPLAVGSDDCSRQSVQASHKHAHSPLVVGSDDHASTEVSQVRVLYHGLAIAVMEPRMGAQQVVGAGHRGEYSCNQAISTHQQAHRRRQ